MSLQLSISSVDCGQARIFTLGGFLAQLEIYRFKRAVEQALNDGKRIILADADKVEFIDSAGIASLIHMRKEAVERHAAAILILKPGSNVRRILDSTNLGRFLQIFATRDEAFESCGIKPVEPEIVHDSVTEVDFADVNAQTRH